MFYQSSGEELLFYLIIADNSLVQIIYLTSETLQSPGFPPTSWIFLSNICLLNSTHPLNQQIQHCSELHLWPFLTLYFVPMALITMSSFQLGARKARVLFLEFLIHIFNCLLTWMLQSQLPINKSKNKLFVSPNLLFFQGPQSQ